MMASNPRVTPVPIPTQGISPTGRTAPPASQTQTPTPLGSTTGNRHVSPSGGSVSSTGEGRKMKRTGAKVSVRPSSFLQAPSWATSLLNSKPSTAATIPSLSESASNHPFSPSDSTANNPILESPEPIRIVSDILPQKTNQEAQEAQESPVLETEMAPKSSLARSAKIQALQQSWMTSSGLGGLEGAETPRDWLGGGLSSEDVSSSSSQPSRKRSMGTVQGGDVKRRLTEVTNGGSSPLSASAGPSDGARRSTRSSQVPPATQGADAPNPVVKPGIIPIQRTVQVAESSDEEDYNDGDLDGDLTTEDDDVPGPDIDVAQDTRRSRQNVDAIPRVETPVPPPAVPPVVPSKAYDPIPKNAKFPFPSTLGRPDDSSSAASSRAVTPAVPTAREAIDAPAPSSPPRRVTRYSSTTKAAVTSASKPAPVSAVSATAEQTMPADILEMEDWEIAPGRVRDERSQTPTNVAFSNAYLTSNQVVAVSEDISFNVVVIKPGGSHQWADEDDKVRICSLAVGKVNVKLDKTDPFSIGPNGMFKLKPGVACSVENRTYIDAVVHVTSIT
ncbi:hypothetical protein CkaCkLH20_05485 [Colletotrichum karsti]|uniref:Uncharacterized protein n=1 Tax=Colletotrichum karsti TaxID=1095194 RepID=A0A9P6I6M7_9PEZI|nr:uncharacterized protein CkaCkLH20_05485 [Colletotrichum karsti]KAF9877219.1 hypothetical protein CkaCkLH20_05485 [Colletotrichum karsti]